MKDQYTGYLSIHLSTLNIASFGEDCSSVKMDGRLQIRILDLDWSKSQSHEQTLNWRELSYNDDDSLVSDELKFESLPIIVDGVFYWMVRCRFATSTHESSTSCTRLPDSCEESIMVFNTKTEKFSVMPHPGAPQDQLCKWYGEHTRLQLMNIDDHSTHIQHM
ncbi:hypothetical protein ACH5RR_035993 [Cinchona calisaya]|uniref:Uncharacterized protein n=1 Tax=Cinchona calisaya TaxID=153742 RepID=A0ABD2Y6Q9_9GENT